MTPTDDEWKDWAWIKAQWGDWRPFWISAAVGFVLGCAPVVPVLIWKGSQSVSVIWTPPFLIYGFVATWFSPFLVAAHIAAFGYLGQWRWRANQRRLIGKPPGNSAASAEAPRVPPA